MAAAQIYARLNVNTSSWISFSRSNASFGQLHLFLWASPGKPGNFNKIQIISGSRRMPDLHKLIWDFAANYSGPETLCPQKCLFSVRAFSCTFFLRKSKGEREKNGDMEGRALTNFLMKKPIWILLHLHPSVTTLVEPHNPNNIHPMPPVFTVPEITGDAKAFLSLCPGAPLASLPILWATLLKREESWDKDGGSACWNNLPGKSRVSTWEAVGAPEPRCHLSAGFWDRLSVHSSPGLPLCLVLLLTFSIHALLVAP